MALDLNPTPPREVTVRPVVKAGLIAISFISARSSATFGAGASRQSAPSPITSVASSLLLMWEPVRVSYPGLSMQRTLRVASQRGEVVTITLR
jgi:hypothetical protein